MNWLKAGMVKWRHKTFPFLNKPGTCTWFKWGCPYPAALFFAKTVTAWHGGSFNRGSLVWPKIIRLVQNYGKNSAILSPHFAGMRITEKRQKYLSYLLRMDAFQRPAWMFKAKPIWLSFLTGAPSKRVTFPGTSGQPADNIRRFGPMSNFISINLLHFSG